MQIILQHEPALHAFLVWRGASSFIVVCSAVLTEVTYKIDIVILLCFDPYLGHTFVKCLNLNSGF